MFTRAEVTTNPIHRASLRTYCSRLAMSRRSGLGFRKIRRHPPSRASAWQAAPWLVSSRVPLNLFEPRIAKRFEAGAEEDRAVAQAVKLGCRLAPPSHLRLVKPNRIQRKPMQQKARIQACLQCRMSSKSRDERPIKQNSKKGKETK
jgi:hypothetical protein